MYNVSVAVQYMNGMGPFGQSLSNSMPVEGGGCVLHASESMDPQKHDVGIHTCVTSGSIECICGSPEHYSVVYFDRVTTFEAL